MSKFERIELDEICRKQRVAASKKQRARIFLFSDESRQGGALKDCDIAEKVGMAVSSIERLRKQCHEEGPLNALERKKRTTPPREVIVDGKIEARIIAEACSPPPQGAARWTLQLLAERIVELELLDTISSESVRRTLKKTNFSLTENSIGASPKKKAPRS